MISDVEEERPRSDTGVEAAFGVAPERKPTNRRVALAGGEGKEGVLPASAMINVFPGLSALFLECFFIFLFLLKVLNGNAFLLLSAVEVILCSVRHLFFSADVWAGISGR